MTEPSRYVEPGRSYLILLGWVGLFAVGVVLDGVIGGLADHWIAWLVAAALVIGINALAVHAARVNKTLVIDAETVRIGEEAVGTADVVALEDRVDRELPVLGWPAGAPRRLKGVTVHLADDRVLVVPTRHPERVAGAIGAGTRGLVINDVVVRPARPDEYPVLAEIDARADALFRAAGLRLPDAEPEVPEPRAVFVAVAGREPIGVVAVGVVDGLAHIEQVAVLPARMKQGIGGRLLVAACDWAIGAGYAAVTLTTFADVAWNGPMYARRGWVELTDPGPELAERRRRETAVGLDDVGRRIAMRRAL